jgi:hypothetical protein
METLKKTQITKSFKCCRFVFIEPIRGSSSECKLPFIPTSTDLGRIQHSHESGKSKEVKINLIH